MSYQGDPAMKKSLFFSLFLAIQTVLSVSGSVTVLQSETQEPTYCPYAHCSSLLVQGRHALRKSLNKKNHNDQYFDEASDILAQAHNLAKQQLTPFEVMITTQHVLILSAVDAERVRTFKRDRYDALDRLQVARDVLLKHLKEAAHPQTANYHQTFDIMQNLHLIVEVSLNLANKQSSYNRDKARKYRDFAQETTFMISTTTF
jgi:DNA replication protein DnaD